MTADDADASERMIKLADTFLARCSMTPMMPTQKQIDDVVNVISRSPVGLNVRLLYDRTYRQTCIRLDCIAIPSRDAYWEASTRILSVSHPKKLSLSLILHLLETSVHNNWNLFKFEFANFVIESSQFKPEALEHAYA